MAEISRLPSGKVSLGGSGETNALRRNMGSQKISVCDHWNSGFNGKSDSFIVDLECFSNGSGLDKAVTANSTVTLQKSFSSKGSPRGAINRDYPLFVASSSPMAGTGPSSKLEKPEASSQPPVVAMAATNHSKNQQQHQIMIKTGNMITGAATAPENWWGRRYNSFKRSPPPWFSYPKRVLLFFATLSSIGTMLLICFTLSFSKPYGNNSSSDWQQ